LIKHHVCITKLRKNNHISKYFGQKDNHYCNFLLYMIAFLRWKTAESQQSTVYPQNGQDA